MNAKMKCEKVMKEKFKISWYMKIMNIIYYNVIIFKFIFNNFKCYYL